MNPPLGFDDALTQLKTLTNQEANFTFTDDEMTQALETAWNDAFCSVITWDDSLTFSVGTWQYAVPGTVDVIRELYRQTTTLDSPERISSDYYEIVDGQIQFMTGIERFLSTGMVIFVKGLTQLTVGDALPTANLVNYVIYSAAEKLLNALIFKHTFVFLRNDTSMADISRALQAIQSQVLRYKQALLREFESA